jgi:hypothetical protein
MKISATFGGLLALALIAAAVSSASASATAFCKENQTPCPAASIYPVGTEFTAELKAGTEAIFSVGVGMAKCTASTTKFKLTAAGGVALPVKWEFKEITFGGCNAGVVVLAPGLGGAVWELGTMNANGAEAGDEVEVTVAGRVCKYEIEGFSVVGGAVAGIVATNANAARLAGPPLCANPAKFNATYELNGANKTMFVSEK